MPPTCSARSAGGPSPPCLCVLRAGRGTDRCAAPVTRRERNDMELWDYVLLCVQCEAYAMVALVLPELVSQWALTDQTLAMTALCLRHVPAEKERSCAAFQTSFRRSGTGCCTCSGMRTMRAPCGKPAIFPPPATHEGISRKNAFEKPAVREKMQRHSLRSRRRLCRLSDCQKTRPAESFGGKDSVKETVRGFLSRQTNPPPTAGLQNHATKFDFAIQQQLGEKGPKGLF